jgi:hypothetical protein
VHKADGYKLNKSQWQGPVKYNIFKDPKSVGPGKPFTRKQHQNILNHNKQQNGGVLRDDVTGEIADAPVQSKRGVPANMNQAEIDHINSRNPRDKSKPRGTNSYDNAAVRTKRNNIDKSNK